MLIILPPSETKAAGGDGSPLDFATLSFPMLNPTRENIASDLIRLHLSEALGVLGVSKKQQRLVECNKVLLSSPTGAASFYWCALRRPVGPYPVTCRVAATCCWGRTVRAAYGL